MTELSKEFFQKNGYLDARQLLSGEWLLLGQSLFTWDLHRGADATGWKEKWMYEHKMEALKYFVSWDGEGVDPPGLWTKHKPSDRWHPSRAEGNEHDRPQRSDGTD